jgi:FKBP-type peptidyl-prolyl cis-trans isomerase FklB
MMSIRKYLVVALLAMFAGAAVAGTTPEGLEYLNANKLKEGVTELPSGLQYRVLKEGPAGGPSPGVSTRCACHYRGTTIDGKEFDSSYSRGQPTTFAPNQVIKGWTEAMQLMKEGDKWELVIPSELAYGDRQMGADITPGAVLVFTLEMIKVGA